MSLLRENLLWSLWKMFILWILISFEWYEFLCRVIRYWSFEWCLHCQSIPLKGMIIMSKRIFCGAGWIGTIPLSAAENDWAHLETLSSYYNSLHMGRKQIIFRKSWCRIERQLRFMQQMYQVKSGQSSIRQQTCHHKQQVDTKNPSSKSNQSIICQFCGIAKSG
jgi:hypothetical protein